jgi:hypothetical protein
MEWLSDFWTSLTLEKVLLYAGLFLASFLISSAAVAVVMVKVPATYFSLSHRRDFLPNSPWYLRYGALIAKNILGAFLVVVGIILSLPGVPGPGLLTILIGLVMLDIPGKRPLEARIIQQPTVLATVNRLRAKYKRPPLIMD